MLTAQGIVNSPTAIDCHGFIFLPPFERAPEAVLAGRERAAIFTDPLIFASVWHCVTEGGFIHQAVEALDLYRLCRIRQLAYLADPVTAALGPASLQTLAEHSRYLHSLDVAALITLVASRYVGQGAVFRLSRKLLKTVQLAGLIHDVLTPGGGDAIKAIDRSGLDEDAWIHEWLDEPRVRAFLRRFGLQRRMLLRMLRHQGPLGQLLDCCDKLAYVARDLHCYIDGSAPSLRHFCGRTPEHRAMMWFLGQGDRAAVCSLWEMLELTDHGLVCRDADRLARFLETRLLLFRHFYLNPLARLLEVTFVRFAAEELMRRGVFTHDRLRRANDIWVDYQLGQLIGTGYGVVDTISDVADCRFDRCTTEAEAQQTIRSLAAAGKLPLAIETIQPFMKRASHFQVQTAAGLIGPLRQCRPDLDERLATIERIQRPWHVYWLESFFDTVTNEFRALVVRKSQELVAAVTAA